MRIYLGVKVKGLKGKGKAVYILEAETSKGPITVTEKSEAEEATINGLALETALKAIKRVKPGTKITLYTENGYLLQGFGDWLKAWQQSNFTTSKGEPIKNAEKWREVSEILNAKGIYIDAKNEHHSFSNWIAGELEK